MNENALIFEAIALHKCLAATYNRNRIVIAPHVLYTRHDELYLDAVTVERDGQPPREIKLSTFKVTGLRDLAATEQPFEIDLSFQPYNEKYRGVTLFAVEPLNA